ncbi:MAG TPA: hypothetical protein VLS96_04115, partial [Nodosilinea sp.]|nr:hypothetical protein [Nodosilinea sp.]
DRARGIEYAFENAWKETKENQKNPLESSFYTHWDPAKAAPALVLNTTVVETGSRLVISPFKVDLPNLKDIRTVACKKDIDLPLSTAAFLSARFTLVTPVAWFSRCDNPDKRSQKARLADGGYFENSGVSTAIDLGSRLEEFLKQEGFLESISEILGPGIRSSSFKFVYLAIASQPSKTIPKAGGFNEIKSPLGALWNSREARGLDVVNRVEYLMGSASFPRDSDTRKLTLSEFKSKYAARQFRQFFLYDRSPGSNAQDKTFVLPLGWLLSDFSEQFIREEIGYHRTDEKNEEISSDYKQFCPDNLRSASNNLCVIRSISEELSPLAR